METRTETKAKDSLLKLYTPVFALISTLESNNDFGEPEELAVKTLQLLQDVRETSRVLGKNIDWVSDAQYAVVAFIDEKINGSNWHGRERWRQMPIAARLNMQPNTGVVFFDKLADWLRNPQDVSEILEVFYVCMGLGFQGRYFTKQDALASLRRDVLRKLTSDSDPMQQLSGEAYHQTEDQLSFDADTFPWMWFFSISFGVLLLLFVILKYLSGNDIDKLMEMLNR